MAQGVPRTAEEIEGEREFRRFCELVQARDGYVVKPEKRAMLVRDGLAKDTKTRRTWLTDAGRKWLDDYLAAGKPAVFDREG